MTIMPIKKKNFELYPVNWRKISWWIINVRADNRCEGILEDGTRCEAKNHELHPTTGKTVVLSVAHLDHNPKNSDEDLPEDAPIEQSNLRAFCQRCHNRWDREHRNESIKQTYKVKHGEETEQEGPRSIECIETEGAQLAETEFIETIETAGEEPLDELIIRKSQELQKEYRDILMLPAEQFKTMQVQTRLTICKQKLGVVEKLISISKSLRELDLVKKRFLNEVPVHIPSAPENGPIRGRAIRKFLTHKNGNTP